MKLLPDWVQNGYLRLIDPVANWLVKKGVHPNTITVFGTLCTVVGGIIYATGHIKTGGWFLSLTALFDVLDGTVARRSNQSSTFGAFLTSYTRARAEALGLDAKVGLLQRPERVVLMAAPQALFGLFFNGWPLAIIIVILTVTAWITVVQRVAFVYTATTRADAAEARAEAEVRHSLFARRRTPRPMLKGE